MLRGQSRRWVDRDMTVTRSHSQTCCIVPAKQPYSAEPQEPFCELPKQELTRAGPEPFGTHPHFQGAPKRQDQKTNQDVGFDALGFLVTVYVPFTIYYYSDYAPPTTAGAIGG